MKNKILSSTAVVGMLLFSGCVSPNPSEPYVKADVKTRTLNLKDTGKTQFEDVNGSETLIKVSHTFKGKNKKGAEIIIPAINNTNEEVKKRGYRYYQIVFPKQISNLEGFPINKKEDLANFINPATSVPRHTMGVLESGATLMDNQDNQNVVDVPFTIFGDTMFNFIIRLVKEPEVIDIVWDAEK